MLLSDGVYFGGQAASYKFAHQAAGCKVGVQKSNDESLRKHKSSAKDNSRRSSPHILLESVETSSRHDESADDREKREEVYTKKHRNLAAISLSKQHDGLSDWFRATGTARTSFGGVLDQVWIVHGAKSAGVFGLVLLDIGLINPF